MNTSKDQIKSALQRFSDGNLAENARHLLNVLGYRSERRMDLEPNNPDGFLSAFNRDAKINTDRALLKEWESVDILFQLMDENIGNNEYVEFQFAGGGIDDTRMESYLFFALKLCGAQYNRTQLSQITREINKLTPMPAMILFQHGEMLTLAVIDRRLHKLKKDKDVLEKATLIKDINFADPHRAHIEILLELALEPLNQTYGVRNFVELHRAWAKTLNTEELNKKFYEELFGWFKWAVSKTRFPENEKRNLKAEQHVIRLITRLLFVWFIKEKRLVADELFDEREVAHLLKDYNRNTGDSYYRAVLQNLFFATLNTEIDERRFSKGKRDHRNFSVYRYRDQMNNPDSLEALFGKTPFINGGLFDCLDDFKGIRAGGSRIDCFSDEYYWKLSIPNRLFFGDDGLISLLTHYKFTVEENTPIEQEVALDPELLGKVFENLLAAYNPATGTTARKQTGSYYTPRVIVDYMVEEALIATLAGQVLPTDGDVKLWQDRLRYLFDYAQVCDDASEWFDSRELGEIVRKISELKILDPALGSGAFPMGVLHKLTLALRRLDPDNSRWEKLQKERAGQRAVAAFDTSDQQERDAELTEISNTFERYRKSDFGRKLYLIQNSIFGVDIQPEACQIAKLRFFISLTIEQEPTDEPIDNFGIKPLPNLETRFIAANTLIGLKTEIQLLLENDTIRKTQSEIQSIREKYFLASTRREKLGYIEKEDECRRELEQALHEQQAAWAMQQKKLIEHKVVQLQTKKLRNQLREKLGQDYKRLERELNIRFEEARKIARWVPYDQNSSAEFFDPEGMLGVKVGFDTVLGNPPYIQLQKDGGKLGRLYEPHDFASFMKTGDIYCLFYEKANSLSRDGGNVCFITSNKWMRAAYGKKLRGYFIEHTKPVQILDMGPDVFDATVDTNILLLQNVVPANRSTFRAATIKSDFDKQTGNITDYLNDNGMSMEMPAKGEPWVILSPAELALKRKIENVGKPLKDWDVSIHYGIKTGCNEAFFIDEAKREELVAQDPKSAEIIKPLLRGRDIKRYHVKWAGLYLLATGYDLDIPDGYPAVYKHLETIGNRIESIRTNEKRKGLFKRDDQGENWWNLRACVYYPKFEKEKVVYPNMTKFLPFVYDPHGFYTNQKCFIITGGNYLKYLSGYFNSRIAANWIRENCPELQGGTRELSKVFFENIPIPPITETNQHIAAQVEDRVDKIIAAKLTNPDADTTALENEIDQIVYSLYDLTPEEIAIVEE